MQEFISETEFKFGDGKVVASIPCNTEGKNVSLKRDVVKSEITLSLSKEIKKATELKIDFVNDRTNIFGKDIHLHFTTSGHYAIPLNETNLNLKTSSVEDSNFVEFNNELFREMGKQFNINIKSTAAESPWSNDIVEKQNGVIGNKLKK